MAEALLRQGLESRLIELLEELPTARSVDPHRLVVELLAELCDATVQGTQREEGLVAKPGKDPALGHQHRRLDLTARGLAVHQMIGILPERARELYAIPEDWAALTALAIGYVGDPASLPEALRERDLAPRARKPLAEFVFGGRWGEASELVSPSTRER